ncbi:phage tail protein [Salmonella enterica subsp. enterica serovar Nottingham]|nr:phage tail protein [Salmonella enterica subsp. enterica serovar Nottingham]EJX8680528.1 phage tail protein [Salmonella enterica]ECB1785188.1 phage tail protein [Salmonella enterica subsp. enterica serovar Nottingham]EDX6894142.1 phage tail protein [Salmonella enterica subsp. enterica serovar Nottingham]EHG5810571.1 phage tail protein [Salmonella enterica subsp. enterica serovar Nottingham]
MADPSLNKPVVVQATRIDASILPRNIFSRSYLLYVINQGTDVGSIAEKANQAGGGAYDAQVRNDEQDVILDKHEKRITKTEEDISGIKVKLLEIENDVNGLKIKVEDIDGKVSEIIVDYVSLSRTGTQTLTSSLSVSGSYSVNGTKVVGARQTGWTAATGAALLGAFNANQAYTVSATYTQSEVSAMATGLQQARQRIKALEDAIRTHGLIN